MFQAGADLNAQFLTQTLHAGTDLVNCVAIGCGGYYYDDYYH